MYTYYFNWYLGRLIFFIALIYLSINDAIDVTIDAVVDVAVGFCKKRLKTENLWHDYNAYLL